MKINVTRRDITKGRRHHCTACPVALAITRRIRSGYKQVYVTMGGFQRYETGRRWEFPEQVSGFIERFDRLLPVEPFSFDLPDEFFCEV